MQRKKGKRENKSILQTSYKIVVQFNSKIKRHNWDHREVKIPR